MDEPYCGYRGDRDAILVAYVYDDVEVLDRVAFEAHLAGCAACRAELKELRGVRARLAAWAPPEPARASAGSVPGRPQGDWWRAVPAWARVAAALLALGASAGIANLDVRYDSHGLTVGTGWVKSRVPRGDAGSSSPGGVVTEDDPVRRGELAELERRLRAEIRESGPRTPVSVVSTAVRREASGAEMQAVRSLIEGSERRQQRELALRIAEVVRDVDAQRRADLVKIDRSLGMIQSDTGLEVMKQREMLQHLVRVSSEK